MKNIFLVGSGGHAVSCIDIIEQSKQFKIKFLYSIDDKRNKIFNYKILKSENQLKKEINVQNTLIAIGDHRKIKLREKIYKKLKTKKIIFPKIISKSAIISNRSTIEEGTIIMNNVYVNSNSKIGKNCIINNFSLIEHDVTIKDHVVISTGVIINGSVKVGKNTFIGSGAIIKNDVTIGENCKIGAGKFVTKDVKDSLIIK